MAVLTSMAVNTLITQFGQEVTLSKPSYGAYDPATGTVSTTSTSTYTVQCYFANYDISEVNSDSVVMGDRKAYFPIVDTAGNTIPAPDPEDTVSGLGDDVKIVRVQELYSSSNLVCYICQVRE